MINTDKLTHNDKLYSRDYLCCDTCNLEIDVGAPTVFLNVTTGLTTIYRHYHYGCCPAEILKVLADG